MKRKVNAARLIISIFYFMRRVFGFQVMNTQKNGKVTVPISQRILALIWFALYIMSLTMAETNEFFTEMQIKNSMLIRVIPQFISVMRFVSMVLTLVSTHFFATERASLVETVKSIDSTLNPGVINLHPKGGNLVAIVGIIQLFCLGFWYLLIGPLNYYRNITIFDGIVGLLPKIILSFFFMDYFTAIAILLQQFIRINSMLEEIKRRSFLAQNFPTNERWFQQQVLNIADCHKNMSKIVKRSNKVYTLQLLVNVAVLYAFILCKTHITIYTIFSSIQSETIIKIAAGNCVHLILNAFTLLLMVEITSRLSQEVSG